MEPEPIQIKRLKRSEFVSVAREIAAKKMAAVAEPQLPLYRVSSSLERSVTAAAAGPVPDCLTCGACCAFPVGVEVKRGEARPVLRYWETEADDAPEGTVINRYLPMDPETGYCGHLCGTVGGSATCGVYEDRPDECRIFEAGSDRCHEIRRIFGLEPQLDEQQLAAELEKFPPLSGGKISFAVITTDSFTEVRERNFEGDFKARIEYKMRVIGFVDEDPEKPYTLHHYDPARETWYESDFLGLTLEEAEKMIGSRQEQGTGN